jgi:PTS system mannose-specific IIB component/fructoselysine and glucoselysine-specific PTS system IIB component
VAILLYRVDERLIHGQVVLGWGRHLRPERYLVVDEELSESEWEQELYRLSASEGTEVSFVAVSEARERLGTWRRDHIRSVLLTRDVATMRELARGGLMEGESVNLGGIHFAEGREQVRPYLYLDADDRRRIRELDREGVSVSARDLPDSKRVDAATLVGEG